MGRWAKLESSHSPLAHLPSTGAGELTLAPQHPDSVQDSLQDGLRTPDPSLRADPRKPLAREKGSHPIWPCPPSPPSATHNDRERAPRSPTVPTARLWVAMATEAGQGGGGAPGTQPAPSQEGCGGCSPFVLCSMLGRGQHGRSGHFHGNMGASQASG